MAVHADVRIKVPEQSNGELPNGIDTFLEPFVVKLLSRGHIRNGSISWAPTSSHSNSFLNPADPAAWIEEINITDFSGSYAGEPIVLHYYQFFDDDISEHIPESDLSSPEPLGESTVTSLPNRSFSGLWESLHFEDCIKAELLCGVDTSIRFAAHGVDPSLISENGVVLLHGPPGTGKTTLCKGLAQKLSIRLSSRFERSYLIEVSAHALFSKWFSESGKLVVRLFDKIRSLASSKKAFVYVLIDEVESLAAARRSSTAGSEPSDAIRVVNTLLTQLDSLKKLRNVIVLATSNVTGAIDLAFVDRADLKYYVGLPPVTARYSVLQTCIQELQRVGIVNTGYHFGDDHEPPGKVWDLHINSFGEVELKLPGGTRQTIESAGDNVSPEAAPSVQLYKSAESARGLSGRALRRLPFLAFAQFGLPTTKPARLDRFLEALQKAIDKCSTDNEALAGQHLMVQ